MKICLLSDLHLTFYKTSIQYDAFRFALDSIEREKAELVLVAGDFTSDGNVFAAKRFVKRMSELAVPAFFIAGDADHRTPKNISYINDLVSPCKNTVNGQTVLLLHDVTGHIPPEDFDTLEKAQAGDIIVLHHPPEQLLDDSRTRFNNWRAKHKENHVFFGHMHRALEDAYTHCLQALDPDTASGENPAVTYFDTETGAITKDYYFCPPPSDLSRYLGIAAYHPLEDIAYAAEHRIPSIELMKNAAEYDKTALLTAVSTWRKAGGKNLCLHAPEVWVDHGIKLDETAWETFIGLAMYLGVDRVTLHVPNVQLEVILKNRNLLDTIAEVLTKRFAMLPDRCVIGIENLCMSNADRAETSRRFGYLPEECVEFMKHLQNKCPRKIGICLDIGHVCNNGSFSFRSPLGTWYGELGKYVIAYHIHEIDLSGSENSAYLPFTELYGSPISLASFFRCQNVGILNKAPIILNIREKDAYQTTVKLFENESKRMVHDLHTHSFYSACGKDRPEKIIGAALQNSVRILGFADHSYGIGDRKTYYARKMHDFASKYADRIKILVGIEIPTLPGHFDITEPALLADYDYCLVEHILEDTSVVGQELITFCNRLPKPCGIAHTDLFKYFEKYGLDPAKTLAEMAKHGIFWEMNVSYDSVHHYKEHDYVKDFMQDPVKLALVRDAGVAVGVGSDCHRADEYIGKRVHDMYDFLVENGIKTADKLFWHE